MLRSPHSCIWLVRLVERLEFGFRAGSLGALGCLAALVPSERASAV